jgi:bidirectional [NiFe] hydrogenase diaphorase subunit
MASPDSGSAAGDARLALVDATIRRHQERPDALLEVLHEAQLRFGYLPRDVLRHVARRLRLPLSRVQGVATFYHFFTLQPRGAHTCTVCTGTACHVARGERILDAARGRLGIGPGQATPDGRVSLEVARCVGTCGLAPVVLLDGALLGRQSAETVVAQLERWERP